MTLFLTCRPVSLLRRNAALRILRRGAANRPAGALIYLLSPEKGARAG